MPAEVEAFRKKYISACLLARERGMHPTTVRRAMEKAEVKPAFSGDVGHAQMSALRLLNGVHERKRMQSARSRKFWSRGYGTIFGETSFLVVLMRNPV